MLHKLVETKHDNNLTHIATFQRIMMAKSTMEARDPMTVVKIRTGRNFQVERKF